MLFSCKLWTLFFLQSFILINGSNGQVKLRNACRQNQFRCSDGSKCLSSERLCNGFLDCPEGEDERGSRQWDCTKVTLSTSCDPETEFKCRFGGCILREKLCDGISHCWGGIDEAVDVCTSRPKMTTQKPRIVQIITRDPLRMSTVVTRPQAVPQTPPPPQRETNQAPRPRPIQPPLSPQRITNPVPQPPPPRRPAASSPASVPKVPSGGAGGAGGGSGSGSGCPPIQEEEDSGFEIICRDPNNRKFDCLSNFAPLGSTAIYRCKNYFSAPRNAGQMTERVCSENGQWTRRRNNFFCTLECGDGGQEVTGLIVGGVSSKKGKWPWHVAMYQEDPPNSGKYEFFCGGSLINSRAVITAAHCVTVPSTTRPRNPREIRVVLGKFYRKWSNRDGSEQERNVARIAVNEEYGHTNLNDDIAIMWLDRPVSINERIRPVCLPSYDQTDVYSHALANTFGQLVGWGRTQAGFLENLQEAKIPVVDGQTCRAVHPTFQSLVRKTTFCAGYLNGTSACDGDSGGGLVFPDSSGQRRWVIQGIVSAGISKTGGGPGCEPKYYSVFTKVGEYLPWINREIDRFRSERK